MSDNWATPHDADVMVPPVALAVPADERVVVADDAVDADKDPLAAGEPAAQVAELLLTEPPDPVPVGIATCGAGGGFQLQCPRRDRSFGGREGGVETSRAGGGGETQKHGERNTTGGELPPKGARRRRWAGSVSGRTASISRPGLMGAGEWGAHIIGDTPPGPTG